jgi:hypothetical protein
MKLPDPLRYGGVVQGVTLKQVLCLVFEVLEARFCRKRSYGHNELPFVRPRSAYFRAESQFVT